MRLIDADALKKKMIADADIYILSDGIRHGYHNCEQLVENAPTIEERKTGKWITNSTIINCSVCKHCSWSKNAFEDLVRSFHYCPNCGARMVQEGAEKE